MDGTDDTPVVSETKRFITRALTRLYVAWASNVCRIDTTADVGEQRQTMIRWLVAFQDALRTVHTRLDELFLDPDCKQAMMSVLEKHPELKHNAAALKDLMSDTCETFIDRTVAESVCEEKLKKLAEGIKEEWTTRDLWNDAVRRVDPDGECEAYAAKLYDATVK